MHYILSDIHGEGAAFERILSMINLRADDHLFILGDVIDRGPDGITLLQRIRQMENCTLLLGNHELMMVNTYLHPEEYDSLGIWRKNGCDPTMRFFRQLPECDQKELLAYLDGLSIQMEISIGDATYVLVHSAPQEKYDMYDYRYHSIREYCVWKREPLEPRLFPDKTVVFGHTMTKGLQFSYSKRMRIAFSDGMIGIDCGCAYPGFGGQLGCLRLEDMTEFYSDEGIVTAEEAWKWRKENVTPFENDRKGDSYERIESGDQKTR